MILIATPRNLPLVFTRLAVWNDPARRSGPENMAIDERLLTGNTGAILRLYRWARPEVTFGYPQRWSDVEPLTRGRPATRRWTGGGLVEHGDDLTITLALPATTTNAPLRPAESYHLIHAAIRDVLAPTYPAIRLATVDDAAAGLACFTSPACQDVLLDRRKIVGGAQRRTRLGLLYQGSLQGIEPPPNFATDLAHALAVDVTPVDRAHSPSADALAASRYATSAWTLNRRG